jgi:electron transfer flavoprotein-quinone oxidoreductase
MSDSFVMKDMKKYQGFGHFLYNNKVIFNQLPATALMAGREMLTVDGVGKKQKQKLIMKQLKQHVSLWGLVKLLWRGWRSVR